MADSSSDNETILYAIHTPNSPFISARLEKNLCEVLHAMCSLSDDFVKHGIYICMHSDTRIWIWALHEQNESKLDPLCAFC